MGLETSTFISGLTATNPVSNDPKGQGDDHIRLLKSVLQATFPNAGKAFYLPTTSVEDGDFTIASTEQNSTFLVDTTAGVVTATLPVLASGDAGWECSFIKTNTGTNPLYITPSSGTLQSGEVAGLAKTRRCIPGHRTRVLWTGTAFIAERVVKAPIASCVEFHGTTLPVGYEWPNGQTLNTTNYPDYASVRGGGTTADRRGRVAAGKDDMGGTSANRLIDAGSQSLNGDVFEDTGGEEVHTNTIGEMVAHDHGGSTGNDTPDHAHPLAGSPLVSNGNSGGPGGSGFLGTTISGVTGGASVRHTHPVTSQGSSTPHNNVQPTIIENFALVVE